MPRAPANGVDRGPWCSAQQSAAAVLIDFDLAQVGEVIDDVVPFDGLAPAHEALH